MSIKNRLNAIVEKAKWLNSNKRILKARIYLRIGAFFITRGALLQPGQPLNLPKGKGPALSGTGEVFRTSATTVFIENMYYNFRKNAITYKFSPKPIKGISERFMKPSKKSKPIIRK